MAKNKRFRIIEKDVYKIFLLMDNDEVLLEFDIDNGVIYEDIENICNILNELNDENEELKQDYNSLRRTAYHIDKIAHVDREYAERLYKRNQQLEQENKQLKQQQLIDKEVEWLRNNTVWEQMPSSKRTFSKTRYFSKNK